MKHPQKNLSTLFIENCKDYPEQFRLERALKLLKFTSRGSVTETTIFNLLSHIASLHNMLNIWHRGVLSRTHFNTNLHSNSITHLTVIRQLHLTKLLKL